MDRLNIAQEARRTGSDGRQTSVQILTLPPPSCITLSRLLNPFKLHGHQQDSLSPRAAGGPSHTLGLSQGKCTVAVSPPGVGLSGTTCRDMDSINPRGGPRMIMDQTPGCRLLMTQPGAVEFPGSEETTDVTFPEAHHIRALTQLPLSPPPPPLCPVRSLVSSRQLPEPLSTPVGKKMNGRPQEDRGQPCSSSRLDSMGKWCSHAHRPFPTTTEDSPRVTPFWPISSTSSPDKHILSIFPGTILREAPPAIQTPQAAP